MGEQQNWDWEIGERLVTDLDEWKKTHADVYDEVVSPDGEKLPLFDTSDGDSVDVDESTQRLLGGSSSRTRLRGRVTHSSTQGVASSPNWRVKECF